MRRIARLLIVAALAASACGAPTPSRASGASSRSALDAVKARGVLVVSLRMELPPGGQNLNDPAHAQKRAFEAKVAELVAKQIICPSAKVELRSAGPLSVIATSASPDTTDDSRSWPATRCRCPNHWPPPASRSRR